MKIKLMLLLTALSATLFSETVSKSSAAFSFPTSVGISRGIGQVNEDFGFTYKTHPTSGAILISWALPSQIKKGAISVCNVSGAKIKTFPITSQSGNVAWRGAQGQKVAKGIYFASLSSGSFKKNLKIFVY